MHGIDDVARAAGVSTATVSRALRGLPNVSSATRERVRQAAEELGYVPSPSAAALASGRTRTIGLMTPWVNRWFFSNVIEGAERALRKVGFDALLYSFAISEHGREPEVDPDVLRRRVDGILVVGLPLDEREVAALEELRKPIVFVGAGAPGHALVGVDDEALAREATEHLVELGHTRIGHITGTPDDLRPWTPPVARRRGWYEALSAAGVVPQNTWEEFGYFDRAGARVSTHRLLDRCPDLTALFVASDEMAMGVLTAARERGLRVPEDLSVIGVDGHELGDVIGLTTMAQPVVEQGALAAAMVLELIADNAVARSVTFPARLVIRTTTGPPGGRS